MSEFYDTGGGIFGGPGFLNRGKGLQYFQPQDTKQQAVTWITNTIKAAGGAFYYSRSNANGLRVDNGVTYITSLSDLTGNFPATTQTVATAQATLDTSKRAVFNGGQWYFTPAGVVNIIGPTTIFACFSITQHLEDRRIIDIEMGRTVIRPIDTINSGTVDYGSFPLGYIVGSSTNKVSSSICIGAGMENLGANGIIGSIICVGFSRELSPENKSILAQKLRVLQ